MARIGVMLRCIFFALTFGLCATVPAQAQDWEIKDVLIRQKEANDFRRISEYLGGDENTGGRIILRTDAEDRGGRYFLLTIAAPEKSIPAESRFVLDYILPGMKQAEQVTFTVPASQQTREVLLGMTGDKEPAKDDELLAWRIRILDTSGNTLAEKHSYLWELPEE